VVPVTVIKRTRRFCRRQAYVFGVRGFIAQSRAAGNANKFRETGGGCDNLGNRRPMRTAAILFVLVGLLRAEPWPLERLFHRPFAWGTPAQKVAWSKQGHTLLFLWNPEGGRFLDLYAYHPDRQHLARLTNLEPVEDPLNRSAADKDERQKRYVEPPEGIGDYDISKDGSRAAFSYRGDLYLVSTSGLEPPFRLTRTKTAETNPAFSPDGSKLAGRGEQEPLLKAG